MVSKSPISWEIKRQVNQNVGLRHNQTISSCHFDFLRLSYFRGISSPCIEFNGTKACIVYRKKSYDIYHIISQNGKHVPKTAQPSPDWPPLSELVSIIRQFPRKKGTLAVRQGERVSTNMM